MKDVYRIRIRKVFASCPGWPSGGSKELSSQTQIYAIPCRLHLPTNKCRSAMPGRSLYLLSTTGLAALGGHYHSRSGTEFSASMRVTCLLPATQADSHAGSKVYIWNVFGTHSPGGEGGGRSIFWKTQDIGLASYSNLRCPPLPGRCMKSFSFC